MFRPRFASAGGQFWVLAGSYVGLGAILCASLATWAISWVAAAALFGVVVLAIVSMLALTFRHTWFAIDAETVTCKASPWGRPRTLQLAHVVRVLSIGRVKNSLPIGVLVILSADGARLGASRWLWDQATLEQVAAMVSAGRVPIERRPVVGQLEMMREIGVDPEFKRNPAHALVLLAAAGAGVLIAWPIVRALLL
ncbi:hypothetical protein ACIBL3_08090 [Kribbella sp. NPDC050124]|uniref:hypothetical protein n=1 Tax=Kribbella sp. NPDC050124 TaxID=3364114 RepID=UPI0037AC4F10